MNIAIVGTGRMARKMAGVMAAISEICLYAVVSRTQQKADSFALEFGFTRRYCSLDEALKDNLIDLVYIATPHSEHFNQMMKCIDYRKPVLCEKAFTVNSWQAKTVIDAARNADVFLCEAMWSRFLPSRFALEEAIGKNLIGDISMVSANLCYSLTHKERLVDPKLAGGALLDVGVYPLSFAMSVLGCDIVDFSTVATLTELGVDAQESMTLLYEGGKMAVLSASMISKSDCGGVICGSTGCIVVDNVNCCRSIRVLDDMSNAIWTWEDSEPEVPGLHYEVCSVLGAIKAGKIECEEVTHSETVAMMDVTDRLRAAWGVSYPFE